MPITRSRMAELENLQAATQSLANTVEKSVAANTDLLAHLRDNKSSQKLSFKPEPFTGNPASGITKFLRHFDKFASYNKIEDQKKAETLPLFLDDSASIFFDSLREEDKNDYDNLI